MSLETHKAKIYPRIKVMLNDEEQVESNVKIQFSGDDEPVFTKCPGDLAVFYARDLGERIQMLQKFHVPDDLSNEELHTLAVENLRRDTEYRISPTTIRGFGLLCGGDHEAGALCLEEVWVGLTDYFADNLIVAISAKDLV